MTTTNLQVIGRDGLALASESVTVDLSKLETIVPAENPHNAKFEQIVNTCKRLALEDGFWKQVCEVQENGTRYDMAIIRFNDAFGGSGPWMNLAKVITAVLTQNKLASNDIKAGDDSILTQRINFDAAINACKDTFVRQSCELTWSTRNILLARIPAPR